MSRERRPEPTPVRMTSSTPYQPWMNRAFDLLRTGQVVEWNVQRMRRPGWSPDLTRLDMAGRSYDGAALSGARLRDMTLHAASFSGADLRDADLAGADLTNADLAGADLTRADLTGARLEGANLSGANLTRAQLTAAQLADANLADANLAEVRATRARLPRAVLRGVDAARADFTRAFLDHATLERGAFDGATFVRASLRHARLRHARLGPFVNLGGADLRSVRGLRLDGEYIRGARFRIRHADPYLALRRVYTGSRLATMTIILLAFLAPVAYRAAAGASAAAQQAEQLDFGLALRHRDSADPALAGFGEAMIDAATPDPRVRVYETWEVLLGLDRGWATTTFISATIGVVLLRLLLTMRVSDLRQYEERSGHAPQWREVRSWWCCHTLAMRAGLLAVLIGAGFSAAEWIRASVIVAPGPDLFPGLG